LLTAGVVVASIASLADMYFFHSGGTFTALIGAIMFAGARMTPVTKFDYTAVWLFLGAAGFEGMSISPIMHTALIYYPTALSEAALVSLAVFASFSVAAIFARRREFFYLSGVIGTVSLILFFGSILNLFLRTQMLYNMQVYMGLGVLTLYVLVDTQVMIERYETCGNENFVRPACDLFSDLIGVFIRILIILMRKSSEQPKQRNSHEHHRRTSYSQRS